MVNGPTLDRRTVLGTLGTIPAVALAGCSRLSSLTGDGNEDDGPEPIPGEDYPAVDEWLTETEVGAAADNYDGNIVDLRTEEEPTVSVGAEGNGNYYAFDPPAIAVATGTEVLWDWTGRGGDHNVVAAPDEQIGESDYEFRSGTPQMSGSMSFSHTFEEAGVALYHCEDELARGMKGAVVVLE